MRRHSLKLGATAALLLTASANLYSADHLDAPAVVTDPAADINDVYVFVNPGDASELILAMTVNPIANAATRFSDAVQYQFKVNNAESGSTITCTFSRPDDLFLNQDVTCTAPGNRTVSGGLNKVNTSGDFRVFAGLRDDPFFFDLAAFNATVANAAPAFTSPGTDFFAGLNTMAIVVGIKAEVFAPQTSSSSTLKVWADTIRTAGAGINAGISGAWFGEEAEQSGHGFHIQVLDRPQNGPYDNDVLVYWFNYIDGEQIFMIGVGTAEDGHVEIPLTITSGPDFGPGYSVGDLAYAPTGVLTLDFTSCDKGNASFDADYAGLSDFTFDIKRLTNIKNLPCNFLAEGQIDRMGRPAVNTALIGSARKDAYNMATDPTTWASQFQAEMVAALDFVDGLEGTTGNALLGDSNALAGVLVDDRLVIEPAIASCGQYLAVELGDMSACGGRTLTEDVMDVTLDGLVAFGAGVSDGVDANDREFMATFPYLATPN